EELREIVTRAVNTSVDTYFGNSEALERLNRICTQFNDAFEGVRSVNNVKEAKFEIHLSKQKIAENIDDLKKKLSRSSSDHALELLERLNSLSTKDLKWYDPLASQVISDKFKLVQNLEETSEKSFMEPFNKMQVEISLNIQNICTNFVESFHDDDMEDLPQKPSHDNSWREDEVTLANVAENILSFLNSIWRNSAFDAEFASDQSEGIYVTDVIVPLIHELESTNLYFLFSAKRQSLASADRRGSGKQPDIIFLEMHRKKIYELIYVECSHLICTGHKKKDNKVKLWREMNDGLCYIYRSCIPARNEFRILGLQVA
ncbi:11871_t:CDS:2, partial [Dentiscutata heterogama]